MSRIQLQLVYGILLSKMIVKKLNIKRAALVGALMWLLVFFAFAIVDIIPVFHGSPNTQAMFVALLIMPMAAFAASIYYKNGNCGNGLLLGSIMAITALMLDALITVPLIELPKGNTYGSFFTYPFLWVLVALNIVTIYVYWRIRNKGNS